MCNVKLEICSWQTYNDFDKGLVLLQKQLPSVTSTIWFSDTKMLFEIYLWYSSKLQRNNSYLVLYMYYVDCKNKTWKVSRLLHITLIVQLAGVIPRRPDWSCQSRETLLLPGLDDCPDNINTHRWETAPSSQAPSASHGAWMQQKSINIDLFSILSEKIGGL